MEKTKESKLVSWGLDYISCNNAPVFRTNFPNVYGTSIAISKFSPVELLSIGGALLEEGVFMNPFVVGRGGGFDNERYAVRPNSKADTKLWLMTCYEGNCCDWSANTAFFNKGELVGVYSVRSKENENAKFTGDRHNLKEIYQFEFENCLAEKGQKNLFDRFVGILKADSPNGEGLHNSYRNAIKEIL